jgi:sigma-B regulation protein RsbU (phosphoserine phosphatase)
MYAIYDPQTRHISLANSGLPYPLLIHKNSPRFLELAGIPVGLFPDSQYQEMDITLESGDVLVFYSDGLVEARDAANEDFGLKRLATVIQENSDKTAEQIVSAVNTAVEDFVARTPFHDDQTLIIVKML